MDPSGQPAAKHGMLSQYHQSQIYQAGVQALEQRIPGQYYATTQKDSDGRDYDWDDYQQDREYDQADEYEGQTTDPGYTKRDQGDFVEYVVYDDGDDEDIDYEMEYGDFDEPDDFDYEDEEDDDYYDDDNFYDGDDVASSAESAFISASFYFDKDPEDYLDHSLDEDGNVVEDSESEYRLPVKARAPTLPPRRADLKPRVPSQRPPKTRPPSSSNPPSTANGSANRTPAPLSPQRAPRQPPPPVTESPPATATGEAVTETPEVPAEEAGPAANEPPNPHPATTKEDSPIRPQEQTMAIAGGTVRTRVVAGPLTGGGNAVGFIPAKNNNARTASKMYAHAIGNLKASPRPITLAIARPSPTSARRPQQSRRPQRAAAPRQRELSPVPGSAPKNPRGTARASYLPARKPALNTGQNPKSKPPLPAASPAAVGGVDSSPTTDVNRASQHYANHRRELKAAPGAKVRASARPSRTPKAPGKPQDQGTKLSDNAAEARANGSSSSGVSRVLNGARKSIGKAAKRVSANVKEAMNKEPSNKELELASSNPLFEGGEATDSKKPRNKSVNATGHTVQSLAHRFRNGGTRPQTQKGANKTAVVQSIHAKPTQAGKPIQPGKPKHVRRSNRNTQQRIQVNAKQKYLANAKQSPQASTPHGIVSISIPKGVTQKAQEKYLASAQATAQLARTNDSGVPVEAAEKVKQIGTRFQKATTPALAKTSSAGHVIPGSAVKDKLIGVPKPQGVKVATQLRKVQSSGVKQFPLVPTPVAGKLAHKPSSGGMGGSAPTKPSGLQSPAKAPVLTSQTGEVTVSALVAMGIPKERAEQCAQKLMAESVDMVALSLVHDGDLRELGIPMGDRKKILQAFAKL